MDSELGSAMTTELSTGPSTGPSTGLSTRLADPGPAASGSSAALVQQVEAAITAVRLAERCDCGRRRADVVRLAHRWVAQQDRQDVTHTVRVLDTWARELNSASRSSGSAGPVVRVGLRLRTPA